MPKVAALKLFDIHFEKDGKEVEPKKEPVQPQPPTPPSHGHRVKTGDTYLPLIWSTVGIAAIIGCVLLIAGRRRKK